MRILEDCMLASYPQTIAPGEKNLTGIDENRSKNGRNLEELL